MIDREQVKEALGNARENGYDFDGWSTLQIAEDLIKCTADFEKADPTELSKVVEGLLSDEAEAAYERHQERLMEDGPGPTLLEQQIEAMKYK